MKHKSLLMFAVALTVVFSSVVVAQKTVTKKLKYGGVKLCQSCHKTRKIGRQYQIWKKGPHAKAYETLGSDQAKKIAKSLDIEEPQKHSKCIECHVTAFKVGPERLARDFTMKNGVGCEACHGPGEIYATSRMMQAVASGMQDPTEIGLITKTPEELCITCHNDRSPTYDKPFTYQQGIKDIAHLRPSKKER